MEKKDIMIIDRTDTIRRIESSRKIIDMFDEIMISITKDAAPLTIRNDRYPTCIICSESELKWQLVKKWTSEADLMEMSAKLSTEQKFETGEEVYTLFEQKVSKTWDFVDGNATYKKFYEEATFGTYAPLQSEI